MYKKLNKKIGEIYIANGALAQQSYCHQLTAPDNVETGAVMSRICGGRGGRYAHAPLLSTIEGVERIGWGD